MVPGIESADHCCFRSFDRCSHTEGKRGKNDDYRNHCLCFNNIYPGTGTESLDTHSLCHHVLFRRGNLVQPFS